MAVFNGAVEVNGASGKVDVDKKHSATFDLAGSAPYTLANNLEPDPYDDWDKQQDKYHQQYRGNSYSPYGYGASDLNYYGELLQHSRLRHDVAALPGRRGLGPVYERRLDVVSRCRICLGLELSVGLDAVSLRLLDFVNSYGWFWQPGRTSGLDGTLFLAS